MAESQYANGKLNVRGTAEITAVHSTPTAAEKPIVMTGTDLRAGNGKK